MKFMTIWRCPGMTFAERLSRTVEWFWRILAHRLPKRLAYWSYIDSGVRVMRSDEVVPEVTYMDILKRLDK